MGIASAGESMSKYQEYVDAQSTAAKSCLRDLGCQPVLFLGSGLSQRYSSGPSWKELLSIAVAENPLIQDEFAYLLQAHGNLAEVGSALIAPYHKYAWSLKGSGAFPDNL